MGFIMKPKYLFLGFIFPLLVTLIYAQGNGEIKGKVYDEHGKPLVAARVKIVGANIANESLEDGTFVFKGLKTGSYWLLVSCSGYRSKTIEIELHDKPLKDLTITLLKEEGILPAFAEVITVTEKAPPDFDINLPAPKTTLSNTEISQGGKANLAQVVQSSPGVSMIGKGGYSLVPSIRGLARNRILLILDGVKLVSERRTGPSASFVNPNDMERIEIKRGPYSVFYGSDAIGGIINISTHSPRAFTPFSMNAQLSYKTVNQEKATSLRLSGSRGKTGYLIEFNGKSADEYSSPTGVVEQSQYSDYNLMLKLNREADNSFFRLMLFHYEGHDIGKPSPKSKIKPTWYPKERNTVFNLGYQINRWFYMDSWNFSFYIYPSWLKTSSLELTSLGEKTSESFATVQASNLGFKAQGVKLLGNKNQIDLGIDFTSRQGVKDINRSVSFDNWGNQIYETETVSLNNATRNDIGLFIKHSLSLNKYIGLTWGSRLDYINSKNPQDASDTILRKKHSLTGYVGSIFRLSPSSSITFNVGKAFRFPSLSELYYYGLTGRGIIFGNPNLQPEKSLNFDLGFRYLGDSWYMGIYGFINSISQIIERYAIGGDYFYDNLQRGRIVGIESEFYFKLSNSWQFSSNFHHIVGEELNSNQPLNDIPSARLFLGLKLIKKRFQLEPRITLAASINNPGPLEIVTKGYLLADARLLINLNENLSLLLAGSNLLNQSYRATADEKGVEAPGRSIAIQLSYSSSR